MNKTDLFIGALIGFVATFLGTYFFFTFCTEYSFSEGIIGMKNQGFLGKVITLGAILNLVAFFKLLKINKELMARGVVLATILLAVFTMFV
ncbi:hypothetical protein H1R85_04615 [Flavobacterium psychrophilum]|uniref:hypothetical protein n=1 Tax=Flavobacterium psychrophilum TaxID=96345 RepID=UPI000B7C2512|nr:hypothetical protein [Flavobacterium psychrophilum]MBF2091787.1 hypothetical protein [Flavobacterium psychrophilum]SNA70335.1 conserved membrane hypothetical protein [Flavobacterium psychrophilum]